jgi:transcriptional regulator with XRE-family HTH domain
MHQKDFTAIIKQRREELKITQEQLAEIAGIGLRTLKNLESENGNPTLSTITKLLLVLGLELKIDIQKK